MPSSSSVAGGDSAEEPGYRPSSSSAPSTASPSLCSGARQSLACHLPTIPGRFGGWSRGRSCRRERAPAPPSGPAQFSRAGRLGCLVRTDCGSRRGAGGRGGVGEGRRWRAARARALRALQPQLRPGGRGARASRASAAFPTPYSGEELSPAAPTLPVHVPPRPTSELLLDLLALLVWRVLDYFPGRQPWAERPRSRRRRPGSLRVPAAASPSSARAAGLSIPGRGAPRKPAAWGRRPVVAAQGGPTSPPGDAHLAFLHAPRNF